MQLLQFGIYSHVIDHHGAIKYSDGIKMIFETNSKSEANTAMFYMELTNKTAGHNDEVIFEIKEKKY